LAVLSTLHRSSDMEKFAAWLGPLRPTHLAVTMLDITNCWGTVIAACRATRLPLAFLTDSPSGMGEAKTPSARQMAASILNMEVTRD
jgi:flagellar biosynthesis GTPase FlhF